MGREDIPPTGGQGGAAVVDQPLPTSGKPLIQVDADLWAEMVRKQSAMERMLEQMQSERAVGGPTPNIVRAPVIAKNMPANYVVWLGPEPRSGELYLGARGRVKTINSPETTQTTDGDGQGKLKTIRGQICAVRTTEYADSGMTSIDFIRRCPANHKYAGRLFAELDCPEHAAYLHLIAPDGKGKDREGNKLYAFHLISGWIDKYKNLVHFRMNRRKAAEVDVDWVASDGVEMPFEE